MQIVKTLNKGIALAKGKYIARMDADDISLPERFEKQVAFMEAHDEVGLCGTWVGIFGQRSEQWQYPIEDEDIRCMFIVYAIDPAPIKIHNYLSDEHNNMDDRTVLLNSYRDTLRKKEASFAKKITMKLKIHEILRRTRDKNEIAYKKSKAFKKV